LPKQEISLELLVFGCKTNTVEGMVQLHLFDLPRSRGRRPVSGRWLSQSAARFAVLEESPVLLAAAKRAAQALVGDRDDVERDGAARFEREFSKRLIASAAELSADVGKRGGEAGLDVTGVEVEVGNGIGDLRFTWLGAHGKRDVTLVNVKRLRTERDTELSALAPFVRLATDPEWSDVDASAPRGYDAQAKVVEWVAGRRKIQPNRDYYALVIVANAGRVDGVRVIGTLGSVRADGRPVVSRHSSKATTVLYVGDVAPIPDDFDVNLEVSNALLPKATHGDVMATILAYASDDPEERSRLASELLDLSPAQLRERLRSTFLS
jgi:hypothetical protein